MTSAAHSAFAGDSRRICAPDETFARVVKFAPVMGITRIANITGLDTVGVPVYTAHRPNSRSLSVMQGKGVTCDDAKTSALMEAVETWHAETIELPLRLGSHVEMSCSVDVVDVENLPRQPGFTPHARILWVEGDDLISGTRKLVPYEMVHLDFRDPLPSGHGCFVASSNGLASGNHLLEALIHGLCEVVETDALATWQEAFTRKVDLKTVADAQCRDIIAQFHAAHVQVGVWEITGASGIPAFLCRIVPEMQPDISGLRPASGMGCHLSKTIALRRALTEAAQSRLTFISGVRDDLSRKGYARFLAAETHAAWLQSVQVSGQRGFEEIASYETKTLEDDLAAILARLQSAGITEVVAIDLTKPSFGIPVARVIVPGLRGA